MPDATARQSLLDQLQHANGDALQAMEFPYLRSTDQDAATPPVHPVVISTTGALKLPKIQNSEFIIMNNVH